MRACRDESSELLVVGFVCRIPVPSELILLAVRWYLRYGQSYRDVEELLAERGILVDHVTIYRWVQRSHRHSSTRHDQGGTVSGTAGSLMRPPSKSPESGNTSTALSTNIAR
jgi:hypothetical protein